MDKVVFISPHPDDETLGCGGAIQKHKSQKDKICWINFTTVSNNKNPNLKKNLLRDREIRQIINLYKFDYFKNLNFESTLLDKIPTNILVNTLKNQFNIIKPNIIYLPYYNDIHSDHKVVYQVVTSCAKWFRLKSLKKLLLYETISETNFNFDNNRFAPNEFHNISKFIKKKIKAMNVYKSEINKHPFPRSSESIESLAKLRGSESGFKYAEAFQCIYNLVD